MEPGEDRLRLQVETLKAELMSNSLINELTKVMQSCTDLEGIITTLLLGIQEIIKFDRVILFSIDKEAFRLHPQSWVGIDTIKTDDFSIPLGFEGGEITDAIFLNRHLIVNDPDPAFDPFGRQLGSSSYLVMPLISKVTRKCWEYKSCTMTSCPAHESHNPYCWSISGAAELLNISSEDERRHQCIQCTCFKCDGVLWMDKQKSGSAITSDDIAILSTIITQAGIIIENFRILNALEIVNTELSQTNDELKKVNHDLQVAQSKINNDLEHARTIQQGLLPQNLQDTEAFSIGARYIPAHAVGGDYYDVFEISSGVYGIIVADVSGHGVASALIMSMAKVLLKTFAGDELSPQKTLERINQTFLTEIKTDNFVTIFYAILDTRASKLYYTSAGHCPILVINKETKSSLRIPADGLFLGVFPDMMLNESSYEYQQGRDRLILYTDGLTEAQNDSEEMFEIGRLEDIALNTAVCRPRDTVEKILAFQNEFCGAGHIPEDDITLLVIDL
ncbi:MAG: SpoIIE family protein phosphatase [Chitinivibrionales bacterium]|nr:SpoIIE family protein phosphatase [Chitinivibrionales bacterium]